MEQPGFRRLLQNENETFKQRYKYRTTWRNLIITTTPQLQKSVTTKNFRFSYHQHHLTIHLTTPDSHTTCNSLVAPDHRAEASGSVAWSPLALFLPWCVGGGGGEVGTVLSTPWPPLPPSSFLPLQPALPHHKLYVLNPSTTSFSTTGSSHF